MLSILNTMPDAYAEIKGNQQYSNLRGKVSFFGVHEGTIVVAEVTGLPMTQGAVDGTFHGFHIHEGSECTGTAQEPFKNAGGHYNPKQMQHPNHAGDLPPLLANHGNAFIAFYTDRFYPEDVVGRTVIIHAMPDDFHTQPSGNSGEMIACGEIKDGESSI